MRYHDLLSEAGSGKIIAYHGTGTRIKQFYDNSIKGNFFTTDKNYALGYGGKQRVSLFANPKAKKPRNYVITVELDIQHMFDTIKDPAALEFYNTKFVPRINAIRAKYRQELVRELEAGKHPTFVDADDLYRYFMSFPSRYDGMLIDERFNTVPAIVPFHASQIKILKTEIVKDETPLQENRDLDQ